MRLANDSTYDRDAPCPFNSKLLRTCIVEVHFSRSGGFAGITWKVTLDSESLPDEEAESLQRMVDAADFFTLPEAVTGPARGADVMEYVVTVKEGEKQHTVRTTDSAAPERLRPLLDYLTKAAKRSAGGR